MELSEVVITENEGKAEAWVTWKQGVDVRVAYISPSEARSIRPKVVKAQFKGHQRLEDQLDEVAFRDYYCQHVIKEIRGLTMDGAAFSPSVDQLKQIWDGNHEFGPFVVNAATELANFRKRETA